MYNSKYTGEQVEGILDKAQNSAYTKSEVDQAISDATSALTPVDLSDYYTSAQTDSAITNKDKFSLKSVGIGGSNNENYLQYVNGSGQTFISFWFAKINNQSVVGNQTSSFSFPTLSEFQTHTGNTTVHVTQADKTTWNKITTDYYTKTEIDGMIGDVESLLASI